MSSKKMVLNSKRKRAAPWSMYQALHDEVSILLTGDGLHFNFHEVDDETECIKMRDTNIMGRFACRNPTCKANGWSSKMIAITIRLYPGQMYNARVYHQRCKSCNKLSRPTLDQSYAERVSYWIKQWNDIPVVRPPVSNGSGRPHNRHLCEGCKAGHCSQSGDLITQLERCVGLALT